MWPAGDVDRVAQPVLVRRQLRRRRRTPRISPTRSLQPLALAHVRIAALVHGANAVEAGEGVREHVAPPLRAGGRQLHDDGVAVAIGDAPGQQSASLNTRRALSVDAAAAVRVAPLPRARGR